MLLLAAGTILSGLWADVSWGRFWGWDPKVVWALVTLLVYLAILHGRYAGLFGNFGMAVGSVLGASAIVFSWYGVNFYLGAGLHAYGFSAKLALAVWTSYAVLALLFFLGIAAKVKEEVQTENARLQAAADREAADADMVPGT